MNIQQKVNKAISSVDIAKNHNQRYKQTNLMNQRHQGYDSQKGEMAVNDAKEQADTKKKQMSEFDKRMVTKKKTKAEINIENAKGRKKLKELNKDAILKNILDADRDDKTMKEREANNGK